MASISQAFSPVSSGNIVRELCSCCSSLSREVNLVGQTLKKFTIYGTPSSVSISSSLRQFGPKKENLKGGRLCSVDVQSSKSSEISPFTEKCSPKKSYGGGLLVDITFDIRNNSGFSYPAHTNSNPDSDENRSKTLGDQFSSSPVGEARSESDASNSAEDGDKLAESHEISSQLPELREVLVMLREKWNQEAAAGKRKRGPGNVFLVGTGPGDPELLTLKALRLMQTADLVLYDRLVSTDVLDLVHSGARLLYVGKTSGFHSRTQEEIHELLLNFAEAGATVVRLKGGDPLVFGRGGEEMDFLQEQGIRVQVVPGITAASGIAAELGIPLTHRGVANSVRYLTGHSRKGGDDPLYVADQAADPDSTLVIYMGLATLPGLAAKLMANGLSPNTPAAAIERGTTAQQRMVFATLADLSMEVKSAELVSPTLIFVGKVVSLSPCWPFKEVASGESSTIESTTSARIASEPRDRRQRRPDPALPSQQ